MTEVPHVLIVCRNDAPKYAIEDGFRGLGLDVSSVRTPSDACHHLALHRSHTDLVVWVKLKGESAPAGEPALVKELTTSQVPVLALGPIPELTSPSETVRTEPRIVHIRTSVDVQDILTAGALMLTWFRGPLAETVPAVLKLTREPLFLIRALCTIGVSGTLRGRTVQRGKPQDIRICLDNGSLTAIAHGHVAGPEALWRTLVAPIELCGPLSAETQPQNLRLGTKDLVRQMETFLKGFFAAGRALGAVSVILKQPEHVPAALPQQTRQVLRLFDGSRTFAEALLIGAVPVKESIKDVLRLTRDGLLSELRTHGAVPNTIRRETERWIATPVEERPRVDRLDVGSAPKKVRSRRAGPSFREEPSVIVNLPGFGNPPPNGRH